MNRVRRKILQFSQQQQVILAAAGVLFFIILLFVQQRIYVRCASMPIQSLNLSSETPLNSYQHTPIQDSRWIQRKGWWGGYWWGADSFSWNGRVWGLGKSAYPWYWEYDRLARDLNLAKLARKNQWGRIEYKIIEKIRSVDLQRKDTKNKATKRRLERTIDRLEYYLYDVHRYQKRSVR